MRKFPTIKVVRKREGFLVMKVDEITSSVMKANKRKDS